MDATRLADVLTDVRPELLRYLTRLTGSPDEAQDVCQTAYVRAHEALDRAPSAADELRRWLFRIATNLALDGLRRQKRRLAHDVIELRQVAEGSAAFMKYSAAMVATPEATNIVREHLDVCFGCVVGNLPSAHAASVLLRELHDFSVAEIAEILGARPTQVKNWIQSGRRTMQDRYAETCALVTKRGMCHQCSELSEFFQVPGPGEIGITEAAMDERLSVLRPLKDTALGAWHRNLLSLCETVSSHVAGRRPRNPR